MICCAEIPKCNSFIQFAFVLQLSTFPHLFALMPVAAIKLNQPDGHTFTLCTMSLCFTLLESKSNKSAYSPFVFFFLAASVIAEGPSQ